MFISYLTWTKGSLDVSGTGVAGIVLSAIHILHHPVQSPPQIVLGPALAIVKE